MSVPAVIEATSRAWQPKVWKPEYTEMVSLSILGLTNGAIAVEIEKRTGNRYTAQHVSNVLNTTAGRTLYQHMAANVRKRVEETIPERLTAIAQKTIERLQHMIENDDEFAKAPIALIDRGMKVALSTGHIKEPSGGSGSGGNMIIPAESMRVLAEAIKNSDNVRKIHAEVIDADVVTTR